MKDAMKFVALVAALIALKRMLDGKPACVHTPGGFKICNY